jgi:2-keto-4-pentenoate hydratase
MNIDERRKYLHKMWGKYRNATKAEKGQMLDDMEYGEGAAPDRSFFQRLTLELSVWPKVRSNF